MRATIVAVLAVLMVVVLIGIFKNEVSKIEQDRDAKISKLQEVIFQMEDSITVNKAERDVFFDQRNEVD
jgi:ABC-type multidrug transport system fused ATPase/permease subunit